MTAGRRDGRKLRLGRVRWIIATPYFAQGTSTLTEVPFLYRRACFQLFVHISLFFTLLTIPFIELLRRELARRGIAIRLGRRDSLYSNPTTSEAS